MSKPPPFKPNKAKPKPKPSLIAAASAQSSDPPHSTSTSEETKPTVPSRPTSEGSSTPTFADVSYFAPGVGAGSSRTGSVTPGLPGTPRLGGGVAAKFKPKVPVRKVKTEVDVKPDVSASRPPTRGSARGRGRGGARGGRTNEPIVSQSVAAGPFGARNTNSISRRLAQSGPQSLMEEAEDYSDNEQPGQPNVIDIDAVSSLGESAPTSLQRVRNLNGEKIKGGLKGEGGKAKKDKGKEKEKDKGKKRDEGERRGGGGVGGVKDEPVSPEFRRLNLDDGVGRDGDIMMEGDEVQDRDMSGRRVGGQGDEEEVNEAQKVDLSESEEEEEEESMVGDFVQAEGMDDPSDKLFVFQFPNLFPKFIPREPLDMTKEGDDQADVDSKRDIKPTALQLRKKNEVLPEGRIGTLVVMKSGKVKVVLGDDVVMDVTPGVPTTFLQQMVHIDDKKKDATVVGEVHKQYVCTPDVDRLLGELFLNKGKTYQEVEQVKKEKMARVKAERGMGMVVDSD